MLFCIWFYFAAPHIWFGVCKMLSPSHWISTQANKQRFRTASVIKTMCPYRQDAILFQVALNTNKQTSITTNWTNKQSNKHDHKHTNNHVHTQALVIYLPLFALHLERFMVYFIVVAQFARCYVMRCWNFNDAFVVEFLFLFGSFCFSLLHVRFIRVAWLFSNNLCL